jgi:divalent metal cation (Fe/Co/Zn/Cd) transporter
MSVSVLAFARRPVSREAWIFRAKALVVFGLTWHTVEAAATLAAGIPASSSALVGFGADVTVETIGGLIVLWRFSSGRALSHRAERVSQRLIGVSYFLLAAYVGFDSSQMLVSGEHPDASRLGLGIAVLSLLVMPVLRQAKARIGDVLQSSSVKREGRENMMCAYLSICLLLGIGLNAALGWWWADPLAAYGVAAIAFVAGRRAWRGVNCCAAPTTHEFAGGISN